MKKLFTLLTLLVAIVTGAWGAEAIGLTQPLLTDNNPVKFTDNPSFSVGSLENVTIQSQYTNSTDGGIATGSNKSIYTASNTSYTAAKAWRKNKKSSEDTENNGYWNQYLGYDLTVAAGYKMNLSHIDAILYASDDATFTWYVQILDNSDNVIYNAKKTEKETTRATPGSLSENLSLSNLTGKIKVRLWVKQDGGSKYFLVTPLTVTAEIVVDDTPSYTMTAAVDDAMHGTAEVSSESVLEGSSATFTASSNEGYKFIKWTYTSTGADASTDNPYTVSNVSENVSLTANFTDATTVSFSVLPENNGTRTDNFATGYCDDIDKFIVPKNLYLSSNNQTLIGWNDGTTTYAIGDEIDCSAGGKTLSPVFNNNSGATFAETIDARDSGFTITWNFGSNYASFSVEGKTAYYVKQATINDASVDIPMFINTSPGKFNTEGDNTDRAQINNGTVLTIPVVNGSVVTLTGLYPFGTTDRKNDPCTQTTINGGTTYELSNSNKTATYTYSGETGTIDIVVGGDMGWGTSLSVTYPTPAFGITYTENLENGSISGNSTATVGESVTVTATPADGYDLSGITITKTSDGSDVTSLCSVSGNTFVMPAYAVTVCATFVRGVKLTWNVQLGVAETTVTTSSTASTKTNYVAEPTNLALNNITVTSDKKDTATNKIATTKEKDADKYIYATFVVQDGYVFTPTNMVMATTAITEAKTVEVNVGDEVQTWEQAKSGSSPDSHTYTFNNAKGYEGTVTMKIYVYGGDDGTKGYRLGTPITISGVISDSNEQETVNVSVGAKGFATYCNADYALDFTDKSIQAYTVSSNGASLTLTKKQKVAKGEPVLLYSKTASDSQMIPAIAESAASADNTNKLVAGDGTAITWSESNPVYILYTSGATPGFYRANNSTVAANKAYLNLGAAGARAFSFSLNFDDVTAISEVATEEDDKSAPVYDLQGRRVAQPAKGLYIVNGKKVIIK